MSVLDKQQFKIAKLLEYLPPLYALPPSMARLSYTLVDRLFGVRKVNIQKIENIKIQAFNHKRTIGLRIYYPKQTNTPSNNQTPTDTKKHAMMYFHGGGCVIGNIHSHDRLCRHLAHHSQTVIISVDYGLAPKHKYPAAVIDAIQAWNWLQENKTNLGLADYKIGAGGDSAGGYLSILLGLSSAQDALPIQVTSTPEFQYLLYPMVDLRALTESYKNANSGMLLTNRLMDYFRDHFLVNPQQANEALASPILFDDLSQLAKTYLLTVEFDPLKDDGIAFANKLKTQSVPITHEHFADCMHSFVSTAKFSKRANQGVHQITKQLSNLCS